jgi:ribose-phosphate pyrophosphokinase
MELLLMIDAVKRAGPNEINIIIPYFGYSRQDRKNAPRVPISAAMVADLIEHVGTDRVITIDLHSEQQQGFFNGPWDNLYGSYTLLPKIKELVPNNLIVVSPDKGGTARANAYARRLNADGIAIVYKERDTVYKNESRALGMIGKVSGKNVLLVDDLVDTGGTMSNAAKLLKRKGAKKIYAAVAHGLFSRNGLDNITKSPIEKVIITDTITPKKKVRESSKVEIVSVAPLIAEVIRRTFAGASLSPDLIT